MSDIRSTEKTEGGSMIIASCEIGFSSGKLLESAEGPMVVVNIFPINTDNRLVDSDYSHKQAIEDFDNSQDTSDEERGAYLLMRLKSRCCACGTTVTSQWRKGWSNDIKLCNACGLRYCKGQYCFHCGALYGIKELKMDHWKICTKCGRATHIECMLQKEKSLHKTCKRCRNL